MMPLRKIHNSTSYTNHIITNHFLKVCSLHGQFLGIESKATHFICSKSINSTSYKE